MTSWTADDCASHWGVRVGTWNSYVSRGQAPAALPEPGTAGRKVWDAEEVRSWDRPGAGRRRTSGDAEELLTRMRAVGAELEELRNRQKELLHAGREAGCEISAMASALGISRQTAYAWLKD